MKEHVECCRRWVVFFWTCVHLEHATALFLYMYECTMWCYALILRCKLFAVLAIACKLQTAKIKMLMGETTV